MLGNVNPSGRGVYSRQMQHTAPDGSTQETPLVSVSYHVPADIVKAGQGGAIFVDRDGVLNRFGNIKSAQDVDKFAEPGAVESLVRLMKTTKLPVYVVTNQQNANKPGGRAKTEVALDRLAELIVANGGKFAAILYCPNRSFNTVPKGTVNGFKPEGGMFLEAANQHHIDLSKSYMVGDSVKDMVSAKKAHPEMQTVLVRTGKGGKDEPLPHEPEAWAENINTAADWIIAKETGQP